MGHTLHPNWQLLTAEAYQQPRLLDEAQLSRLSEALDDLHSAASEGDLRLVTDMSRVELLSWLSEIIYVAQETVRELDEPRADAEYQPKLYLVRKSS